MAEKKELMVAPVEEFIAAMNPKKEFKRKMPTANRTQRLRHSKKSQF
jgi:hypothetical protein